jgi:hypothetical protein
MRSLSAEHYREKVGDTNASGKRLPWGYDARVVFNKRFSYNEGTLRQEVTFVLVWLSALGALRRKSIT